MKLRAIDITRDAEPANLKVNLNGKRQMDEAKTYVACKKDMQQKELDQEETSRIIKMPSAGLLSAIAENETTQLDLVSIDGVGQDLSEHADDPESVTDPEAVTDPELIELLEQLSVTIDTANTVLDAAASANSEEAPTPIHEPILEPQPEPDPEPKPDSETDDPPPLAAQFASLSPSPPPPAQMEFKQRHGFPKATTAGISVLAVIAGIGWLLYTNPWLTEETIMAALTPETSVSKPVKEKPATILASVAPETVSAIQTTGIDQTAPRLQSQPLIETRVRIDQPVTGKVGQQIALNIDLPENTAQAEMSIMIQGMPEKARLSAGKSLGSGNWLLGETDLQDLILYTAASFEPAKFDLDVILVRSDGKVPEVHKLSVIIEPASTTAAIAPDSNVAPPSSATSYDQIGVAVAVPIAPEQSKTAKQVVSPKHNADPAPPLVPAKVAAKPTPVPDAPIAQETPVKKSPAVPVISRQEVKSLMTRANSLLDLGDVAGARLLLEFAAQRGSKQAMLKMSDTYDPVHLNNLGVHGVKPDQDQAAFWTNRAANALEAQ